MVERSFKIGEREFKLRKVDAFKQFHIVRRLGPILGDIIPVAKQINAMMKKEMTEDEQFDMIAKIITPIMSGLSKLSDDDADTVLKGLCSAAEVHQPEFNSWAKIVNGNSLMIQDMDLPTLLQVAGRAFAFNLSDFFSLAPQVSPGGK